MFFRLTENIFEGFKNRANGIRSPSLTRIGSELSVSLKNTNDGSGMAVIMIAFCYGETSPADEVTMLNTLFILCWFITLSSYITSSYISYITSSLIKFL